MILFAYLLFIIASLMMVYGGIMVIVEAFRASIIWGLLVLFVSPAGLIFVILNWHDETVRKPFLVQLVGLGVMILGALAAVSAGAS